MQTSIPNNSIKDNQLSKSMPVENTKYRADIDGLRAISILAVFLYHLFPGTFRGGFIGVDIFFVISGFLISKIIFSQLQIGKFSFIGFYIRRIKRIFPALIFILLSSLTYGFFVLFPDEFSLLGKHVTSASAFLSNLTLHREAGYFDFASEQKPFLHLWSLAVEEQFYVFWPFFLWSLYKISNSKFFQQLHTTNNNLLGFIKQNFILISIFLVTIFSYALNVYLVTKRPSLSFYFTGSRLWEMSCGSLLAYIMFNGKLKINFSNKANVTLHVLSTTFIASIPISFLFLSYENPYFIQLLLFPLLGALLLLYSYEKNLISAQIHKLFSIRALVFIGLISYPIYLFHWPFISFIKIVDPIHLSLGVKLSIFSIVLFISFLIYQYIEKPIRASGSKKTPLFLLLSFIFLGGMGYLVNIGTMKPYLSYKIPESEKITLAFNEWDYPTNDMRELSFQGETFWKLGSESEHNVVLFFGDSNMEQYAPRISAILNSNSYTHKTAVFATWGGLCPIPNVGRRQKEVQFVKNVIEYAKRSEVKVIVITAMWMGYLSGTASSHLYLKNGGLDKPENLRKALRDFENMLLKLRELGKEVYIITGIPYGDDYGPKHFFHRNFTADWKMSLKHASKTSWNSQNSITKNHLINVAKNTGAIIIDPEDTLCSKETCKTYLGDDFPIYKDVGHLRPSYVKNHVKFLDFLFK